MGSVDKGMELRDAFNDVATEKMVSGSIQIRSGSKPTDPDGAATGTLLATIDLDATPVAASSGGVASFNDLPLSVVAEASGTAGQFRVLKSDGSTVVYQGVCSEDGTEAMTLSTTELVAGVAVTVTIASHSTAK